MSIAQLHDDRGDLQALMTRLGRDARDAAAVLAKAPRAVKDTALRHAAGAVRADTAAIAGLALLQAMLGDWRQTRRRG